MTPTLSEPADTVTFFFDPACPWTWLTSRWFVDATGRRGTQVRWRAFSLACINEGRDVPEQFREPMQHSQHALRVVESLTAEGRHDHAGSMYTELGSRIHVQGRDIDEDLIAEAGRSAGVTDVEERARDESLDDLVRAAYHEIAEVLGDDVGSPALRLDATGAALFGPVVNPQPGPADADRLLAATLTLLEIPSFHELKRSRKEGPMIR